MIDRIRNWLKPEPVTPNPPQYVAWCRKLGEPIGYLIFDEERICWTLTNKMSQAFRFNTIEEAKTASPFCDRGVYDGKRRGILQVRGNRG